MQLLLNVLNLPQPIVDQALKQTHDVELLNKIQNVSQEVTESWKAGIPLYAKQELGDVQYAKLELLSAMLDEYNCRTAKDEPHRMHLAEGSASDLEADIRGNILCMHIQSIADDEFPAFKKAIGRGDILDTVPHFLSQNGFQLKNIKVDSDPVPQWLSAVDQAWASKCTVQEAYDQFGDEFSHLLALQAVGAGVGLWDNDEIQAWLAEKDCKTYKLPYIDESALHNAAWETLDAIQDLNKAMAANSAKGK